MLCRDAGKGRLVTVKTLVNKSQCFKLRGNRPKHLADGRHDAARVEAAGQTTSHRHIGTQLPTYCEFNLFANQLRDIALAVKDFLEGFQNAQGFETEPLESASIK